MTVQVVIPYLSMLWCLEDCLENFGKSDIPVLVVDNSENQDTKEYGFRNRANIAAMDNVEYEYFGENIGISAAWNRGLLKGADQTIVMSQMVRLAPAEHNRRIQPYGLDLLAKWTEEGANEYGCTFGDQGYHLMSIGRKTVETIGYFDENFLAYGEDDDYGHRINLAGIEFGGISNFDERGIYSIGYGAQQRMKTIHPPTRGIRDYYSHKWCSVDGAYPGDYPTPFNNPDVGLEYWPKVGSFYLEMFG